MSLIDCNYSQFVVSMRASWIVKLALKGNCAEIDDDIVVAVAAAAAVDTL